MRNYVKLFSLFIVAALFTSVLQAQNNRAWQLNTNKKSTLVQQSIQPNILLEASQLKWENATQMEILKMREDYRNQQGLSRANGHRHYMDGPVCQLRASDHVEDRYVAPPEEFLRQQVSSESRDDCANIIVTYNGFTPEAQAAYQYAVDIWESLITSPVTIRVQANFTPLGPGILGSAGPVFIWRDFPGAVPGTWYGEALADKIFGADLSGPGTPDIVSNFSSTFAWYYGRDGQAPPGTYDFVTVVLHELGHGLGFFGSAAAIPAPVLGIYGFGAPAFPTIYDRFTEDGGGTATTSIGPAGVVSPALGAHFQGDNLFVDGPNANAGNGGNRPAIYAPFPFRPGSSYSHFDEATFPAGNQQSLMTPFLGFQEANHNPGPACLGMFEDHGWMQTRDCPDVRPIDDKERCDITGISFDPNFPAPGVCHEQFTDPTLTSPGTFVACFRVEGIDPYNAPVDGSGYKVIIDGEEKPILALGYDTDGGGNQYLFICVGEIAVKDNQTVFIQLERGCTYTRRDWLDAPPCDVPAGTNCDITGVRDIELTCFNEEQQGYYGENTYGVAVTFDAVDFVPEIFDYFQAVVNNREIDIVRGRIIPGGFTIWFVMEKEGKRGNDLFVRVDMDRGCTYTARDLWDDLDRDCVPEQPGDDDDDDDDDDDERCDITGVSLESGPLCTGDGEYGIRLRVEGQGFGAGPANLKVVVKGVNVTDLVESIGVSGDDRIISIAGIPANGAWNVDVFVQWDNGCTYTARDLFRAPERDDCRPTRQAGPASGINVYPNPTKGTLNIESTLSNASNLVIFNSLGQTVYKGELKAYENKQVNMSRFESGLYIIRMDSGNEIITKRIVLNK